MDPTKTHILVLREHDEDRELDFELEYQLSLTTQQRFEMMFRMSSLMAEMLARREKWDSGRRERTEITKRA